jgi:hypothetical protein
MVELVPLEQLGEQVDLRDFNQLHAVLQTLAPKAQVAQVALVATVAMAERLELSLLKYLLPWHNQLLTLPQQGEKVEITGQVHKEELENLVDNLVMQIHIYPSLVLRQPLYFKDSHLPRVWEAIIY